MTNKEITRLKEFLLKNSDYKKRSLNIRLYPFWAKRLKQYSFVVNDKFLLKINGNQLRTIDVNENLVEVDLKKHVRVVGVYIKTPKGEHLEFSPL